MADFIYPESCCRTFGAVGGKVLISLVPKLTVSLSSEGTATVPYLDWFSASLRLRGFPIVLSGATGLAIAICRITRRVQIWALWVPGVVRWWYLKFQFFFLALSDFPHISCRKFAAVGERVLISLAPTLTVSLN